MQSFDCIHVELFKGCSPCTQQSNLRCAGSAFVLVNVLCARRGKEQPILLATSRRDRQPASQSQNRRRRHGVSKSEKELGRVLHDPITPLRTDYAQSTTP